MRTAFRVEVEYLRRALARGTRRGDAGAVAPGLRGRVPRRRAGLRWTRRSSRRHSSRALEFEELPGATDACRALAAAGLRLAVVSNWDVGLHDHLASLGLDRLVDTVVTSAEAGAPKPAPQVFELALARLGATAARTVHVGDAEADAEGARAAGLGFEPAPLADAARRILA